MQTNWKLITQRILPAAAGLLFAIAASQANAATSSGTLTVTATVTGSIQLLFNSGTNGVTLTGANSNAATLAFGSVTAYGTNGANITTNTTPGFCSSCFSVSTPISIVVNAADSSSSGFSLQAYASTPTNGEKLSVDGSTALGTSSPGTSVLSSGTYGGSGNTLTVYLGIPTASSGAATYTDTLNFLATAN